MKKALGIIYIAGGSAVLVVLAYLKLSSSQAGLPWVSLIAPIFVIYQGLEYFLTVKRSDVSHYAEPSRKTASDDEVDSDPIKRKALVSKLKAMQEPIVSIQEFFDGNINDLGSIGCNLYPSHPGIDAFRSSFQSLLDRRDVSEIYVHISEIEPDEESWPYTDRAYVFGSISRETLEQETAEIQPTEISESESFFEKLPKGLSSGKSTDYKILWWD